MKRLKSIVIALSASLYIFFSAVGCTPNKKQVGNQKDKDGVQISISVGAQNFSATLADNATAQAFIALFPLTLDMSELNGNEKYNYLGDSLPANATKPGTIHAGDLMLYGTNCVVLFYKTFSSSYSYTRIGWVDNAKGLASALGSGNVTVTFAVSGTTEAV
ncbi:MAG: hypothetical protein J1F69_01715 [Clostridiales bacterium]|nr:hypothetical protein [Clostridiales bacterium]